MLSGSRKPSYNSLTCAVGMCEGSEKCAERGPATKANYARQRQRAKFYEIAAVIVWRLPTFHADEKCPVCRQLAFFLSTGASFSGLSNGDLTSLESKCGMEAEKLDPFRISF